MIRSRLTLVALLALLAVPFRPAYAIDATPFVGVMIPANSLLLESTGGSYVRMESHTVYGIALSTPLTEKIGAEVVLGTGTGKMELVGGTTALNFGSTLFFADLRGRLRLLGTDESSLGAVLGIGYTDFKNGLLDLAHESDQGDFFGRLTGVAGAELHSNLSERIRLNVTVVDRVHVSGLALDGLTGYSEKTQNDIMATAGLTFGL